MKSNGQQHPSGAQILHGLQSAKQQEAMVAEIRAQHVAKLEMFAQQDKMTICGMASRIYTHGANSVAEAATIAFDLFEACEAEWARRGEAERVKQAPNAAP